MHIDRKNTVMFRLVVIAILSCSVICATAQVSEQQKTIKRACVSKVAQLNDYVSFISDKRRKLNIRDYYRKKAQSLFISNGYDYELNGVHVDGVIMVISSTRNNSLTTELIRNYLTKLMNLRYSWIKITSTEVADIKVSDCKLIDEDKNMYTCTVQYVQINEAGIDGELAYKDKAIKRITCYIQKEEVADGVEYIVRFGDTHCMVTETL